MIARTLASGLAALSIAGMAVVGTAGVASAQESSSRCATTGAGNNANSYAPQGQGRGVSDDRAERGQRISASSGCAQFAPGREIAFGVESVYQQLGTTTSTQFGEATATFTVPSNLENGRHDVVFTGPGADGGTNTVRVPFTVVNGRVAGGGGGSDDDDDAAAGGTVSNNRVAGVLPRTGGTELVAIGVGGAALVAAGAGMVVAARRRREDTPAGVA